MEALVAVETVLGWAVQGPVSMFSMNEAACMHFAISEDIDKTALHLLQLFWASSVKVRSHLATERPSKALTRQSDTSMDDMI